MVINLCLFVVFLFLFIYLNRSLLFNQLQIKEFKIYLHHGLVIELKHVYLTIVNSNSSSSHTMSKFKMYLFKWISKLPIIIHAQSLSIHYNHFILYCDSLHLVNQQLVSSKIQLFHHQSCLVDLTKLSVDRSFLFNLDQLIVYGHHLSELKHDQEKQDETKDYSLFKTARVTVRLIKLIHPDYCSVDMHSVQSSFYPSLQLSASNIEWNALFDQRSFCLISMTYLQIHSNLHQGKNGFIL